MENVENQIKTFGRPDAAFVRTWHFHAITTVTAYKCNKSPEKQKHGKSRTR